MASTKDYRILVVDDAPDLRELLIHALSAYNVDAVDSGLEALSYFSHAKKVRDPYSLFLIDAAMPGMTGYEVVSKIREAGDDAPALIMTGHPTSVDDPHALHVGAQGVIPKPFDLTELLKRVEGCLNGDK